MVKKKARRESKSAFAYISVAVLLIMGLTVYGTSVFLKIIVIEVVGASKYLDEDIIRASGLMIGDSLLFMDKDSVSQRILASMPSIDEANIEIILPDRVRINVNETTAIAAFYYSGSAIMINSAGRVLEQRDHVPLGLIEIRGFTPTEASVGRMVSTGLGDETKLRYLIETLEAMERGGIHDNVSLVDVTNIAHVTFQYYERFTVILGTTENIENKLDSLPEIITQIETSPNRNDEWRINLSGQIRVNPIR